MDIMSSFKLKGKVCVITGAGGALCSNMAIGLGSLGVKIAVLDINLETAKQTAAEIQKLGGQALAKACNVLEKEQLSDCCRKIKAQWGSIDLLITGAGGNDPRSTTDNEFLESEQIDAPQIQNLFNLGFNEFSQVFSLNFLSTFLTIQVFGEAMVRQKHGSIVTISSMSADIPLTKVPAYSAAKAAVSNFTRWLAVYFSHTGVRVNGIAPGFFMTEQLRFLHVNPQTGELSDRAQKVIAHTPLGRYGEPEDLLGTVIWLLSDASRFVTGAVIPIDGGFSSYSI